MIDIKKIADEADMIVNGYAFKRCEDGFRVLNLNKPNKAYLGKHRGRQDQPPGVICVGFQETPIQFKQWISEQIKIPWV